MVVSYKSVALLVVAGIIVAAFWGLGYTTVDNLPVPSGPMVLEGSGLSRADSLVLVSKTLGPQVVGRSDERLATVLAAVRSSHVAVVKYSPAADHSVAWRIAGETRYMQYSSSARALLDTYHLRYLRARPLSLLRFFALAPEAKKATVLIPLSEEASHIVEALTE